MLNSGQVYCISGLQDMVLDFGTVPKNLGWLESLNFLPALMIGATHFANSEMTEYCQKTCN